MAKILMSVNNLTDLPDVDGYVLGYEKYSFFASHYFSYDEIKDFDKKDKIFLLLNLYHI